MCVYVCVRQFSLLAHFSASGLRSVDPLTPEVVMNFTRGNVYAVSVYTINLCAFLHVEEVKLRLRSTNKRTVELFAPKTLLLITLAQRRKLLASKGLKNVYCHLKWSNGTLNGKSHLGRSLRLSAWSH